MAIITEQNCPTLRFLKWKDKLANHPEFRKWKASGASGRKKPYLRVEQQPNLESFWRIYSISETMTEFWESFNETISKDIWTASVAYGKGFESATDSLCRHRTELYATMKNEITAGCFIQATKDTPLCLLYDLTLHDIKKEKRPDGTEGVHILWDGIILMVLGYELVAAALCDAGTGKITCSAVPALESRFVSDNGSIDAGLLFEVFDNLAFRKYANTVRRDVEAKPSKQDRPQSEDEKIIFKTTLKGINRYDINWYTESVRTAGFARKGFMAVRWKGHGKDKHPEIVPVRPTWVKGYTRKAKKPHTDIELKDLD